MNQTLAPQLAQKFEPNDNFWPQFLQYIALGDADLDFGDKDPDLCPDELSTLLFCREDLELDLRNAKPNPVDCGLQSEAVDILDDCSAVSCLARGDAGCSCKDAKAVCIAAGATLGDSVIDLTIVSLPHLPVNVK